MGSGKKIYTEATCSLNTSKDYKASIMSRINNTSTANSRSKCPSSTQCETGILLSKMSIHDQNIGEIYDSYQKGLKIQKKKLLGVAKTYFDQFQDSYIKLKVMAENLSYSARDDDQTQLNDILCLFKVPILFKSNPDLLIKTLSKEKGMKQSQSKKKEPSGVFCAETKSVEQTLKILESLLAKVMKSEKMMEILKGNTTLKKFFKRMVG